MIELNSCSKPPVSVQGLDKMQDGVTKVASPLQLGLSKITELGKNASNLYTIARNAPGIGMGIATTMSGISELSSGNYFSGFATTATGVEKLVYSLKNWKSGNNKVSELIQDAKSEISFIISASKASENSLEMLSANLKNIEKMVDKLNIRITETKELAQNGRKELSKQNLEILQSLENARNSCMNVHDKFAKVQKAMDTAYTNFESSLKHLDKIAKLTKDSELGEKEALAQINQACETLSQEYNKSMQLLSDAIQLNKGALVEHGVSIEEADRASELYARFSATAQHYLSEIDKKAEIDRHIQEKLDHGQKEIKKIQGRLADIKDHANSASDKLDAAYQAGEEAWGWTSTISCAATAVVSAPSLGLPAALAAGAAAGGVVHKNRDLRNELYSKAVNQLEDAAGIVFPKAAQFSVSDFISFKFDDRSSGLWGRFIERRPSFTLGTLTLKLGEGVALDLRVDLNNKQQPIRTCDIAKLIDVMKQQVAKGKLRTADALAIAQHLETMVIDRGDRHPPKKGLISANYLKDIKEPCQDLMDLGCSLIR
ncbi:MAG: hypothetical protein K0S74_552 [Chlamydiales bacterium]|jgi:hypothetical protein|nr:hypothetical protein [Chlamydiales bacterium]